ncbi:glucose dehydrogenase [FAD, quinone]-like [Spodoptera litura]|uniref:Glucose dehydrogenase [FAD, quinone]-like n=1 Tax=Spodoptera litura TaxID=69820 RepID=A0A9J7ISG8_SPOLT|nr:glucose dehydrogenase [FAD, quinone]-like [Spodoptera litura]
MSSSVEINEFFKFLQSLGTTSLVEWIMRVLTISQAIFQTGWPENYEISDCEKFDFIVVGSGSAGSVVAARLSEIPKLKVLLIEAGGDPPPTSVLPGLSSTLPGSEYDWNYTAVFDEGVGQAHQGGSMSYPRGKLLGGCSSINSMIYSRGVPEDYENWNRIAPGWDWKTVLHYFKKLENMEDPVIFEHPENARLHSTTGPVKVSRPPTLPSTKAIDDSRLQSYEEMGIPRVLETNGPEILGAARPHFNMYGGRRSSTAESYLRPAKDRPNLKVAKYSTVTKVLIDSSTLRAYGVQVYTSSKKYINVYATEEVIVSAGTFNSPKILLQSGIGPGEELSKLRIKTLVDLPVGKNLHDHQTIRLHYKGKSGLETALQNIVTAFQIDTIPDPVQCGAIRINGSEFEYPSKLQPQFQFFNSYLGAGDPDKLVSGCSLEKDYCLALGSANINNEIDTVIFVLLHPLSRGQVKLRSTDPLDDPIIELGYFRSNYDLKIITEGVKYMNTLINTTYFREVKGSIPRLTVTACEHIEWGSDEFWECYVKNTVVSIQHAVGTCWMGQDGVVDERLRVHNVTSLRVVDASVIPLIPSGNTNAPTMMIGEKAADMIKEDFHKRKKENNKVCP